MAFGEWTQEEKETNLPQELIYETNCEDCGIEFYTKTNQKKRCTDCQLRISPITQKKEKRKKYMREWMKKYRQTNKDYIKKLVKIRHTTQKYREWRKIYRKRPVVRYIEKQYKKRYRLANLEKIKKYNIAYQRLRYAKTRKLNQLLRQTKTQATMIV